jgi:hypothetical protein
MGSRTQETYYNRRLNPFLDSLVVPFLQGLAVNFGERELCLHPINGMLFE